MRTPPNPDRLDGSNHVFQASDMAVGGVFTTTASSGSVVFNTVGIYEANRYGIATMATGTATNGRATVLSPLSDSITFSTGQAYYEAILKTPTNLSDATNRYALLCGFADSAITFSPAAAILFRYRDNINSGKWQAYAYSGAGNTTLDLGITVAANTWYRLEIAVDRSSGGASFYIDGTYRGRIEAPNIPTSTEPIGCHATILKAAGTTARTAYLDYLEFSQEVSR